MSRTTRIVIALGAVLGMSSNASADLPNAAFYIGPNLGVTLSLDGDWDLNQIADAKAPPNTATPHFGVKIGGTFAYWVSLEANINVLLFESDLAGTNQGLTYTLNILVNLMRHGNWVPYLVAGGGAYQSLSSGFGDDADYRVGGGIGVRGLLTKWLLFRAEVQYVLTDGSTGLQFGNNLELTVGLDFLAWASYGEAPVDNDWDKDGILNDDDACPRTYGHKSAQGCPDRDGDGIVDSQDRCPDNPGPKKYKGCPDRDGDTVVDIDDACPDVPGEVKYHGCPDRDGDGIPDNQDKCPDVPGIPELMGCPPEKPLVLEGVNFEYNKATLLPESMRILDGVARTMKEFPKLVVKIVGHTDSDGPDAYNMKLSLARADSVRTYLNQKHGIAVGRMQTDGQGETQPRATNKTPEGRAKNRRIEFHIISK